MEPPAAPTLIPLVGHIYGMYTRKFEYPIDLAKKTDSPIVTLNLPGQKVYVVLKPQLVQIVQKLSAALSFTPIKVKFSLLCTDASQKSIDIFNQHLSDDGEVGIHAAVRAAMKDGTTTGREVDMLNRNMISEVSHHLDALAPASGAVATTELYSWLKDTMGIATTNVVWGPHNPYRDPAILDSFWEYEGGLTSIMLMPAFASRGPVAARDRVARAFEHYYSNNYQEKGSLVARGRYKAMSELPLWDIAKFEALSTVAFLVNTIPPAFWLLFYIYAEPGLLEKIRAELDTTIRTGKGADGITTYSMDITSVKDKCPLLLSTYQETLRLHAMQGSVREVTKDIILLDRYLLKKGALIQMPTRVIHTDREAWGDDADDFRASRFMKGEKHLTPDGKAASTSAFRAFGGAKTLCPGRFFATNEILAVVAVWVARFDTRPTDGEGWKKPTAWSTSLSSSMMTPDNDITVDITRRAGYEDGVWKISLTDTDEVLSFVAEDK